MNPRGKRLESCLPKDHVDHIAEKGPNSMSHYNLVHKFVPMPQAMKIPDVKAAVDKRMGVASVADDQRKEQKGVILEAHKDKKKVHFGTRMDICHLKKCGVRTDVSKVQRPVVLRSDMVKDDSGSYPVLTEQGSSASQMPAAKIMDVIARQPDCAGQAADAVAACTQVKLEDAPRLLKIPKSECPDLWIRLPRHQWPKKKLRNIEDPTGSSRTKSVRTPTCWPLVGKTV